ncbi:hypothetical protein DCAR_0522532 [Daucus carota subsp. sativus]|uniref:F-box associated domain-containing protein n=1 Tax=Daucus carota subsp. sativus TaxID=79200 RepID=A0AAF0X830_DAUCS|nr:hypothetical protein DCAR_0522532 [Daucus carota subsp. sativus]
MDSFMKKPSKKRNGIDRLPTEICRFVCRSWQNLLHDRNLVSLHLSQFSGADDDAQGIVKKISIPFSASMPEFTVELPKNRQYEDEIVLCGFGYHPETKQYKVVKIVYYWIGNIEDHRIRRIRTPLRSKSEIWVMKEYNVKETWIKEFKIGANKPESPSTRELIRVLCILGNDEILIEYKVGRLASYNLMSGRYKDITLKGMPGKFQTVLHFGSLNQIDLPVNM